MLSWTPQLRVLDSQDRNLTSSKEWRSHIQQVDAAVLSHLRTEIQGGFDEEQFGSRIGFGNLKT